MPMDHVFAFLCLGSVAVWAVYRLISYLCEARAQRLRERRWGR